MTLDDKPASSGYGLVGRRAGAYTLDIALLFAVLGPLGWGVQIVLGLAPSTGQQVWATLLLNFSLPTWIYFAVADASAGGATLGKHWLGLTVSRDDGGRLGPTQALGRTAVKLLPWELTPCGGFWPGPGCGAAHGGTGHRAHRGKHFCRLNICCGRCHPRSSERSRHGRWHNRERRNPMGRWLRLS